MPQFTKEELHLLKLCFDINAGDFLCKTQFIPRMVERGSQSYDQGHRKII